MYRTTTVTFAFALLLMAGCSKPTDTLIPTDVATWDKDLAPSIKKLSDADRKKIGYYLARAQVGQLAGQKGVPLGTTVGDALAEQTKWEAAQAAEEVKEQALKKKMEAERAASIEKINKAVTVTLLGKRELYSDFSAGRTSDYQEFRVGVMNSGDKAVDGVSGELVFIDIFGKELGKAGFRISEKIEPGKTYTWVGGRDYNKYIDTHRAIWNLEEGKYKTRFVPDTILFSDGSKLSAAD